MANTSHPRGFRFVGMASGSPSLGAISIALGSGVPIKIGDPIQLASGYGQRCLTTEAPFAIAIETVVKGSTGTARKYVMAVPCTKQAVWKAQTITGTAFTAAMVGSVYGMGGSSGVMGVTLTLATTAVWKILKLDPNSAVGSLADVHVVCAKSAYEGQTGAGTVG